MLKLRPIFWVDNNSSDGRVIRASASGAGELGLIPSRIKLMILKLGIHSFHA